MAKRVLMVITPAATGDLRGAALSAAALARESGGVVRMMYVGPLPLPRLDHHDRVVADADREMARLGGAAEERMAALRWEFGDVPVEHVVRFGRLAAEVAIEARGWDAELVGLAARAGRGLRHELRAWYLSWRVPVPIVRLPLANRAGDRRVESVVLPAFR